MSFTDCISEIDNTQIDDAKYIDVVMPVYNLIEYSNNYFKRSESLWQYYGDDPIENMENFESFQLKVKIIGKSPNNDNKKYWNSNDIKIFKYLENFWNAIN